jgi:hypothetical protein
VGYQNKVAQVNIVSAGDDNAILKLNCTMKKYIELQNAKEKAFDIFLEA